MAASINANTFFIPENPPTFFEKSSFGFAMNLRFVYLHKCEFNYDLLLVSIAVPIQKNLYKILRSCMKYLRLFCSIVFAKQ